MEYNLFYHSDKEYLAYNKFQANNDKNGILFLCGYRADMNGTKATGVAKFAKENGIDCVRFDYSGIGRSSGKFVDGTIGRWLEDALLITDNVLDEKKYVLVGSSMGGWIMLLLAMLRPEKFVGLIGLAAAPDFTEELIWNKLCKSDKLKAQEIGFVNKENDELQEQFPITFKFIDEARKHLILNKEIPIYHPIRLIHGMKDTDISYQIAFRLLSKLESDDVNIHLIKEAAHRLSRDEDFKEIFRVIKEFI